MIGIIDYGIGNLFSVKNALDYLEIPAQIIHEPNQMKECEALILPGVGAFRHGMHQLHARGWETPLKRFAAKGGILLGICLGMQLLFEQGEEGASRATQNTSTNGIESIDSTPGLGLVRGKVSRFGPEVMVPHVGWSPVTIKGAHPLTQNIVSGDYFYFVHSYRPEGVPTENIIGVAEYDHEPFPCIVAEDNVMGTQFHPEKSSSRGIAILEQFGRMIM